MLPFRGTWVWLAGMPPSPSAAACRRILLLGVVLVLGFGEAWWGASALLAAGVAADVYGTAGGLDLIPLKAVVIGGVCAVGALCAMAWQMAVLLKSRRSQNAEAR